MKELSYSKINAIIKNASDQITDALGDEKLKYEAPLLIQARKVLLNELSVLRLPNTPPTDKVIYGTAIEIVSGLVEDQGFDLSSEGPVHYPTQDITLYAQLYELTKRLRFSILTRPATNSFGIPDVSMAVFSNYDLIELKKIGKSSRS